MWGDSMMDLSSLSEKERANLDRMNRDLVRFAYEDMVQSDNPGAIGNWLRMSSAVRSGNLYSPEAFIRLP